MFVKSSVPALPVSSSIAAARLFGLQDGISFISTAGGGLIRFLAGEKLAVVEALQKSAARFRGKVMPQDSIDR